MKKYYNSYWSETRLHETVLGVLKSRGFEPVVDAIRNKLPATAEALLMEVEADHSATAGDYTAEENIAIESAIEECWKRVERLYSEQKGSTV